MNSPTDTVLYHSCGCVSLAVENAPGDRFFILRCARDRRRGYGFHRIVSEDDGHKTDPVSALVALDSVGTLISDGFKFRKVKELLNG